MLDVKQETIDGLTGEIHHMTLLHQANQANETKEETIDWLQGEIHQMALGRKDDGEPRDCSRGEGQDNSSDEFVYHEFQTSLLCGIHALNTLVQRPHFTKKDMEVVVDKIRLKDGIKGSLRRDQLRSKADGNYDISVVMVAAKKVGIDLTYLRAEDVDNLLNGIIGSPAYIVRIKSGRGGHYFTLRFINGHYWDFDSEEPFPQKLTEEETIKILLEDDREVLKAEFKASVDGKMAGSQFSSFDRSDTSFPFHFSENGLWWSTQFLDGIRDKVEKVNAKMSYTGQVSADKHDGVQYKLALEVDATATLEELLDQFILTIGAQETEKNKSQTAENIRVEFQMKIGGKPIPPKYLGRIPVEIIRFRDDVEISREEISREEDGKKGYKSRLRPRAQNVSYR